MKNVARIFAVFSAIFCCWNLFAEQKTVTGYIFNKIRDGRIYTLLSDLKGRKMLESQVEICKSADTAQLNQLEGMSVQINGKWQISDYPCFEVSDFHILFLANGRKPHIGTLEKVKKGYIIREDNFVLPVVSDGLRELLNTKVIIDVKLTGFDGDKKAYVVSYAPFPKS